MISVSVDSGALTAVSRWSSVTDGNYTDRQTDRQTETDTRVLVQYFT